MAPGLDVAQPADGAQQVLVDRVMMIHRELHHPDDPAEIGNEPAKHAGLVHPAQRRLRRAARGQDFQEQPVRLRVLAQRSVDALQRLGDEPRRGRMDRQIRSVGHPENSDQIDGIALEGVGGDHIDAIVLDLEVGGVGDRAGASPEPADEPVEYGRRLRLALLERSADDRRQVADVLGDEEIVLHEALDVGLPRPGRVAELPGDRPLHVETQPLLGAAGEEMQPAAHRPQEFLAAPEKREFARRKQARRDQLMRIFALDRHISRSRTAC